MIVKLPQYRRKGHPTGLKSIKSVSKLILYLTDQNHPKHVGQRLTEIRYGRIEDPPEFLQHLKFSAKQYVESRTGPGAPWAGNLAEHIVFSPPPGSALSGSEKIIFEDHMLDRICPDSPALICWHDDHLHLVASNFCDRGGLRVTRFKAAHGGGYLFPVREIAANGVDKINHIRSDALKIPTLAECRTKKRKTERRKSVYITVAEMLNSEKSLQELLTMLEHRSWKTATRGKKISLRPPGRKQWLRFEPELFLARVLQSKQELQTDRKTVLRKSKQLSPSI